MLLNHCPHRGFLVPLLFLIVSTAIIGPSFIHAQELPQAPTAAPEPASKPPQNQQQSTEPSFKPAAPDTSSRHDQNGLADAMRGGNRPGSPGRDWHSGDSGTRDSSNQTNTGKAPGPGTFGTDASSDAFSPSTFTGSNTSSFNPDSMRGFGRGAGGMNVAGGMQGQGTGLSGQGFEGGHGGHNGAGGGMPGGDFSFNQLMRGNLAMPMNSSIGNFKLSYQSPFSATSGLQSGYGSPAATYESPHARSGKIDFSAAAKVGVGGMNGVSGSNSFGGGGGGMGGGHGPGGRGDAPSTSVALHLSF